MSISAVDSQTLQRVVGKLGEISRKVAATYADKALSLELDTLDDVPTPPSFAAALKQEGISLIAEIKRKSPSKGMIAALDPVEAARAYQQGGARALSVLTEKDYFGGSLEFLAQVARDIDLPLLRKDFIVHPLQIYEAKRYGASAVLLIVAVLGEYLAAYLQLCQDLQLDALVEVHDRHELEQALEAKATIIGVNNRDLRSLDINLHNAPQLIQQAQQAGYTGILVAESGYSQHHEIRAIAPFADAVLVGSHLAGSGNLREAVKALMGY